MPKLASAASLFQTPGYEPSLFAVTQLVVQPGGSCVTPGCSKSAEPMYTERLTTKLPGKNHGLSLACAADPAGPAIATTPDTAAARGSATRQRPRHAAAR
jgi:hypothetical protein